MRRRNLYSNPKGWFPGRYEYKFCCDDCCQDNCNCDDCKPKCCPAPSPQPVDCCPASTPQFALVSFNGTLEPTACVGIPQTFNICTSASCNLVGQQVFFETVLGDAAQSDNVTILFLPPGGGAPIPVPFINGISRFPSSGSQPLRNGCSQFRISFNEPGLYVFTVNVIRPDTGVTIASEKIGITVTTCPQTPIDV